MTILFNTARSRYPDVTGDQSGEFTAQISATIKRVLNTLGARVFQNSFIEDGTMRVPGVSFAGSHIADVVAPAKRRIITQDVQPSLIVKKRMFSTLKDAFDINYMDEKERLYIRAVKTLFRKKCEDIAFYESLIYVDKIIEDPDFIYGSKALGSLFGAIFGIADLGVSIGGGLDLLGATQTSLVEASKSLVGDLTSHPWIQQLLRIREASEQAKQNKFTTWIVNPNAPDMKETGPGIGVMEFTMMTGLTSAVGLQPGDGTLSISLQDPYKLSIITEADIDRAVKEAYFEDGRIPSYITERGKQIVDEAMLLDSELNDSRRLRRVSEVNFNFPFGTNTAVSATLVQLNLPFTETDLQYDLANLSSQYPDATLAEQRFTATERVRVTQIFNLLTEYKVIQDRAIDEFQLLNNLNSDIVDRMRQEFVGQHIIQHMDAVHVFINSFTRDETPVYDSSIFQVSKDFTSAAMSIDDVTARISDEFIDQERKELAPNIDLWIYKLIRNANVFRGTGPQVWQGIVNGVTSSYQAKDGVYTISINANDNLNFLNLSSINTNPGLTQIHGALEEPLTPYDIKVEPTTGLPESVTLLPENLQRIDGGLIKFHDYPYLGRTVKNSEELLGDTSQSNINNTRTFRHANGLLYRWKRGVLSVTQNINVNRPLGDSFAMPEDIAHDYGLTVATNIFAKLDAADILSILICGQPYNYNTFARAALDAGSLTLPNEGGTSAYFDYLFDIFERSNPTNGLFIPAKAILVDRKKAIEMASFERQIARSVGSMNSIQSRLAGIQDKLHDLKTIEQSDAIKLQMKNLQDEQNRYAAALKNLQSSISNVGDVRIFGNTATTHIDDAESAELSKRLAYTLVKKPEDVKYNRDKNFFVVSDRYDSDLLIQSFIQDLKETGAFKPFENTYKHPIDIAKEVAGVLKFELFADSQGNIVFRPPEYNKMPLSLMIRLIQLGQTDGLSLVPPFVENLIKDRLTTYKDRLLVIELEIRERVAFLGGVQKINNFANGEELGFGLMFVTRPSPAAQSNLVTYAIDDVALREAAGVRGAFTEDVQAQSALLVWPSALDDDEIVREVMSVRNDLRRLIGRPAEEYSSDSLNQTSELLTELQRYKDTNSNSSSEKLRLTNEISVRVSKRQILINTIIKLTEQQNAIADAGTTGTTALLGAFFTSMLGDMSILSDSGEDVALIPSFLQDMVVNDLHNTFGRNSGKRFVIDDDVMIDMQSSIHSPGFTRLDVYGSENLLGAGPDIVNGNPIAFWAGASDFDMWRQFGYKATNPETIPYLTNPETQLAPYAVMRLLQERGKIHQATVTVIGNEHYQAGDTVYITSKEMLYYVEQVTHVVDLNNNSFTTKLSLSYGRPLGQYIPQPFDIIGRTLLSDAKRGGLDQRVHRAPPTSSQVKILETLYFPGDIRQSPSLNMDDLFANSFVVNNAVKIKNAVIKANSILKSRSQDSARIEIRGYTLSNPSKFTSRSSSGEPLTTTSETIVKQYMTLVRQIMTTGIYPEVSVPISEQVSIATTKILNQDNASAEKIENKYFKEGSDPGVVVVIDQKLKADDIKYRRMPSQNAWVNGARSADGRSMGLPINSLDIALIIEKNVRGDSSGESSSGKHEAPPAWPSDASATVPDNDMGFA